MADSKLSGKIAYSLAHTIHLFRGGADDKHVTVCIYS